MEDFNIDLLKCDIRIDINLYYNSLTSNCFAPYILQPTRLISKSLIDNIFINTIEYGSYSGNITIQLADHLFQFVTLEGFFHDIKTKKHNIKERNFEHFNEREFLETLHNLNVDNILRLDDNDPNKTIKNLYNNINYILDEFAPYKKLSKNEMKLKTKPWINAEAQYLMWKRDKLFKTFCKAKDDGVKQRLYAEYEKIRNDLTTMKRHNKKKIL